MSSHSPSVAQGPEGAIVKFAVHEQRDLDLPGQRFRTNFIQQQPTGVLPVRPLRAGLRQCLQVGADVTNGAEHATVFGW
jgi:hypothetical protein